MAGTAVHRHGVRGRRVARGPPARRPPLHGRSARLARAGGRGARRSACEGRRPSRREAREPAPDQRRCSTRRRLRDRERRGAAVADDHGDRPRYCGLPLAGAGARRKGDAGQRPVRPCGGRVRAPDRKSSVRVGEPDRGGDGSRAGRGSVGIASARPGASARAGQGSGAAFPDGHRVRSGAPQRTRGRRCDYSRPARRAPIALAADRGDRRRGSPRRSRPGSGPRPRRGRLDRAPHDRAADDGSATSASRAASAPPAAAPPPPPPPPPRRLLLRSRRRHLLRAGRTWSPTTQPPR